MALVALDTDVLAELSGPERKSETLRKWLLVRKQQGDLIVVVPQVIAESEQASVRTADARLNTVQKWCDGIVGHDAYEVLRSDLVVADPASYFRRLRVASQIWKARKVREQPSFQSFLRSQRGGYDQLRLRMPEFDRKLQEAGKYRVEPFLDFVRIRRWDIFGGLVRHCIQKGIVQLPLPDQCDLERLWDHGKAFRLLTLVVVTNEYRIGAKLHRSLKGCMTDLRVLFESAYVDEVVTKDVEQYECGSMLIQEGLIEFPKFVKWPLVS
jgi:hypothetical protein